MSKIIKSINREVLKRTARRCHERHVVIPTFKQLINPDLISEKIKERLKDVGLWDVNPVNLFRITWKNDTKKGLYGKVNYVEIPREITGVKARIFGLIGKYFPTGSHKVGAAFGCLVPRLVSGEFDPEKHKAVWPSTGNYCRGGAYDCSLLGCTPVAVLPREMSKERFDWLHQIGAEVHATPGCESNVKEIYDKCWELRKNPHNIIFNQFEEFGNPIFHYNVTGRAIEEAYQVDLQTDKSRLSAYISATGSAGTIAAGDYLKKHFPQLKVVATEARQCPTLFMNGFGAHRIEGIGDKHVPWVHNVRHTDAVAAIDDEDCLRIMRLFNETQGKEFLKAQGIREENVDRLSLLGISSICNVLAAIKTAKYFEMDENDMIFMPFTDSMDMYQSRLLEQAEEKGQYSSSQAGRDWDACVLHQSIDWFKELTYWERKAIHHLKYYTWVEQQGKTHEEIMQQWNPEYWRSLFEDEVDYFDELIEAFNAEARTA